MIGSDLSQCLPLGGLALSSFLYVIQVQWDSPMLNAMLLECVPLTKCPPSAPRPLLLELPFASEEEEEEAQTLTCR